MASLKGILAISIFGAIALSASAQLPEGVPVNRAPPVFGGLQVVFYVEDVRESVAFYRDQLGFELDFFVIGSAKEVAVLGPEDPEPYAAEILAGSNRIVLQRNSGEVRLPASGSRFHIEVSDPAAYYDRLVERGLVVHHLIRMSGTGVPFMFSVNDPDGQWLFFRGPLGKK